MNQQTAKLIEELSAKLGTTAEHLWGVLVKQALISSAMDFITIGFFVWITIRVFKWAKSLPPVHGNEGGLMDSDPVTLLVRGVIWLVVVSMVFTVFNQDYGKIFSGFVNPEYWALKQIIK